MTIKAVFFDLDGTLVDSNEQHVDAWHKAFSADGFHIDRAAIRQQIGKGGDMLVPALMPDVDEDTRKSLSQAHDEVFQDQYLDDIKPFPAARALLEAVKSHGQEVVLASSAKQSDLDHYVKLLDAASLIGATTSADDVDSYKPAPDIFSVALKKLSPLKSAEVIVVGDTPYDVEAAFKAGISAVGLLSGGFTSEELRTAGAVEIYDDVSHLLAKLSTSALAV